jgi:hypothetical protein
MKAVLLTAVALLLVSCGGGSKIITTDRKISEIQKLAMFEPIAVMIDGSGKRDTVLDAMTRLHMTKVIDKIFPMSVAIYDLDLNEDVKPALTLAFYVILSDMNDGRKDRIRQYLPMILSMMEEGEIDYVLAVSQVGHTGHKQDQEAHSQSYAAIFDRQKKNIAYYGFSGFERIEPTLEITTEHQFTTLFKSFFETK